MGAHQRRSIPFLHRNPMRCPVVQMLNFFTKPMKHNHRGTENNGI